MSAPATVAQTTNHASATTIKSKADYHQALGVPNVAEAARIARTLVERESLGNVATIDQEGYPVAYSEYYIDGYNTGEPILILLNISSVARNIKNSKDGKVSFSIRTGDHQPNDHVDEHYPGGLAFSTAGSPRISIKGSIKIFKIEDPIQNAVLEAKFIKRHPDSKFWLPGSPIAAHRGQWAKLEIESVYFIGGFGDRAFIGDIPADTYKNAEPLNYFEFKQMLGEIENKNSRFQSLVENYKVAHHQDL